MDTLDSIRREIDAVDEKIIGLLSRRLELVKKAGSIKSSMKAGVFEQEREKFVLNDRIALAKKYDIPEALVQDVLKRLLRESYQQNLVTSFARSADNIGPIVIVGGRGAMGTLFARLFESSGYEVRIADRDNFSKLSELVVNASAVIISVPIDVTVEVIQSVAPLLDGNTVLCDFTSVKHAPLEAMLSSYSGPVAGFHPMFGPDTKSLVKQVIVEVRGRHEEKCAFLRRQFEIFGARIVECSAEEHDEAMSVIQALRHFTTYYYGVFLKDLNPDVKKLVELSSPIYRLELVMVARLFAQDPNLYYEIISASKHNRLLIQKYSDLLQHQIDIVKTGNKEEFIQSFMAVRDFFGELAPKFLKESAGLLAKFQDER